MAAQKISVTEHQWHVIINPNACNQRCFSNWREIEGRFQQYGIESTLHKSERSGMGTEIARTLCAQGVRHFIVIGGDGTINEVVNGIFTAGVETRDVYMAVLPLGRGNDWARTHHFPDNFIKSIEVFLRGRFTQHDIGKVATQRGQQKVAERYFINIAGFCFDADVIYDTTYHKPHFLGISVYILSLVRTLFSFKSPRIRVRTPNGEYQGKSMLTVAAICQYNGGGMRQAPMAVPNDGLLDVVIVPDVCKLRVVANIKNLFTGTHLKKIKGIQTIQVPEVVIESDERVRGEVEGELLETGDYHITLIHNALNTLTAAE